MKLLLGILGITIVASRRDACEFVGYRLARVSSRCVHGFCKDLFVKAEGGFITALADMENEAPSIPLSCSEAQEVVDSMIGVQPESPRAKRVRADCKASVARVLTLLSSVIIPELATSKFSHLEIRDSLRSASAELDHNLFKIYTECHEDGWNMASIQTSKQVAELRNLWIESLEWLEMLPLRFKKHTALFHQMGHFLLDIASVVGAIPGMYASGCSEYTVPTSLQGSRVLYRERYQRETAELVDSIDVATASTGELTALIDAIDGLAAGTLLESDPGEKLTLFLTEFGSGEINEFIEFYFEKMICGRLAKVMEQTMDDRLRVSIIDRCSGNMSLSGAVHVSTESTKRRSIDPDAENAIAKELYGMKGDLVMSKALDAKSNLAGLVLTGSQWVITSFLKTHPVFTFKQQAKVKGRRKASIPEEITGFRSGVSVQELRALGRLLGGVVLTDNLYPLEGIQMHHVISAAIRAEQIDDAQLDSFLKPGARDREQAMRVQLYEPAFHIRRGITDVLGVGGVFLFNPITWARLMSAQ